MCENDKFDVSYEIITQNLAPVTQQNKLGARQYVVAPVSMLVPGVLNGSAGALYYPLEEISKNVDSWNMMPLTLGHPNKDGMGVSARSPEILENYALGFVFNARIQDKKLVADAWFDKERTSKLSPALLTKLETGEPVELSTGLYTENVPVKNKTWKDKPYNAIARNYRPDHLAILMDVKGACSLNDGCGLNVNEEQEITPKINQNPAESADVDNNCPFNRSKVIESQCPFGR